MNNTLQYSDLSQQVQTPQGLSNPNNGSLTSSLQGYLASAQQNAQQTGQAVDQTQNDVTNLMTQLQGKTADQTSLQQQQHLPQMTKELQDLVALQTSQSAKYLQNQNNIMGNTNLSTTDMGIGQQASNRQHGIEALVTGGLIQAKQGNITYANQLVNDAITQKYSPIEDALKTKLQILQFQDSKDSKAQQEKLLWQQKEVEAQKESAKNISDIMLKASQFGAPQDVLDKLNKLANSGDPSALTEAIKLGGRYSVDPLDRSLKSLQIQKLQQEVNESKQNALASSIVYSGKPGNLVADLFAKNPKLKSNQDINNASAVVSSIQSFADSLKDPNKIKGYGFLGGGFAPEFLKSQTGITNKANISAIEGKVQQWLSGAALSTAQEKLVKNMIPERNDTDKTIQTKLTTLANYMLGDIKGRVATQGSSFEYIPSNPFTREESKPNMSTLITQAVSQGFKTSDIINKVMETNPEYASQIQQARSYGYTDEDIISQLNLQ